MTQRRELDTFRATWNVEAEKTLRILEALPRDQYDFRADPEGRSIGEMAWHLSEIDACLSFGIVEGRFSFADVPPNLKRPLTIEELAPGYRRIHEEAVARLAPMENDKLNETVTFFDGRQITIRDVLWNELLHHTIHHRAHLGLMCRLAGGIPPGIYGPNREEMRAMQEKMK